MTDSFQSTAFESSRRPVDTFVSPVRVQPKTNLMALAETMAEINPTLQKFVSFQIEKEKQKGILEGRNKVLGSTPEEINKLKKELEKKEGKRFAKNFVGGNIYMQYGIEEQLAINLGNASEAKTKKFFNDYVVDVETPKGIIKQPLSEFDINSNQFQQAINDFQQTSLVNTRGIRPELVNKYVLPKQNLALEKVYKTQVENLADAKIAQANLLFSKSILNSYYSIDNYNDSIESGLLEDNKNTKDLSTAENLALGDLQYQVNNLAKLGLTSTVSPTKIFDNLKNNAYEILDYYEKNDLDPLVAEQEIEQMIDWIGNLKVTNNQPLSDFYYKDGENQVLNLLTDIDDKIQKSLKKESDVLKLRAERDITRSLQDIDFNMDLTETDKDGVYVNLPRFKKEVSKLVAIRNQNKDSTGYFLTKYESLNTNVDLFFSDMRLSLDKGDYAGNIKKAETELETFMAAVLPIASKEDLDNYTKLKKYIKDNGAKSITTKNSEMTRLIKRGEEILSGGKRFEFTGEFNISEQESKAMLFDLNEEFYRLAGEHQDINEEVKINNETISVRNWYKKEIQKIKNTKFIIDKNTEQIKGIEKDEKLKTGAYEFNSSFNNTIDIRTLKNKEAAEQKRKDQVKRRKNLQANLKTNTDQFEAGAFSDGGFTTVDISSGDTLSGIANDFGISMQAIMKANGITNANQIDIGDVLLIPEGITDLNKINFIENLDKTKIISAQDHPYAPVRREHNFKVILDLAKAEGIKYPELVAAQAMHESAYGDKKSSENNFLGIKATTSEIARGESELKDTTEDRGKGLQAEKADFKKFENLKEMIRQYKIQWNDNFEGRKGTVNADTVLEALKLIKAEGYATDKDYVTKVINLLNDAKTQGWY